MAPEMLGDFGYDFSQDWWSFGCLLYDMLCSDTPFHGLSDRVVTDKILYVHPTFPATLSTAACSLIAMLLDKDPAARLSGVKQIKSHAFFQGVDWAGLNRREVTPVFIPSPGQPTSTREDLGFKLATLRLQKTHSLPMAGTFDSFEYVRRPPETRRHSVATIRASLQ